MSQKLAFQLKVVPSHTKSLMGELTQFSTLLEIRHLEIFQIQKVTAGNEHLLNEM